MSGKGKKRKSVKLFINPILLVALLVVLVAVGIAAGSYLYSSSRAAKTAPPNEQPSSRTKTETETVLLEEPVLGSPDAPVTIIEFSDFQCPFCGGVSGQNEEVIQYLRSRDPNWEPIVPKLKPYIEAGQVRLSPSRYNS